MNLGSDPGEIVRRPFSLTLARAVSAPQTFLFRKVARAALETVCYKPPRLSCSKIVCTVRDGLHHHFSIRKSWEKPRPPTVGASSLAQGRRLRMRQKRTRPERIGPGSLLGCFPSRSARSRGERRDWLPIEGLNSKCPGAVPGVGFGRRLFRPNVGAELPVLVRAQLHRSHRETLARAPW